MKHILMSTQLTDKSDAHCYLMTDDPTRQGPVLGRFMELTEGRRASDIVVMTELDDAAVKLVREILAEANPEIAKGLAEATDFHLTMWTMPDEHPRATELRTLTDDT